MQNETIAPELEPLDSAHVSRPNYNPPAPVRQDIVFWSIGLSAFWVVALWGFWTRGVFALGVNATVFLLLFGALLRYSLREAPFFRKELALWSTPFVMLTLSYSLYENPFFKMASIIVLPLAFGVFYFFADAERHNAVVWRLGSVLRAAFRPLLGTFWHSMHSALSHGAALSPLRSIAPETRHTIRRIAVGLGALVVIGGFVIVPLLAGADSGFEAAISSALRSIGDVIRIIFSSNLPIRLFVLAILSIAIVAFIAMLMVPFKPADTAPAETDAIVSGIVLGGTLGLYLLFLWIQVDRMWSPTLPLEFRATEMYVKGGFWQLIMLSLVNLALFSWVYRRTTALTQRLLVCFTGAALFLVASSAHRMYLYVTIHGLSYEKFYATYTVIFCIVLYSLLLRSLFRATPTDVAKTTLLLFVWMYGVVSLAPVERMVLAANIELSTLPGSRVQLSDLQMLSADVLSPIRIYVNESSTFRYTRVWNTWLVRTEKNVADKAWYEHTLSSALTKLGEPSNAGALPIVDQPVSQSRPNQAYLMGNLRGR